MTSHTLILKRLFSMHAPVSSVARWLPMWCLLASTGQATAAVEIALRLETSLGHNSNLFRNDATASANATDPDAPTPQPIPATATGTRATSAAVGIGIPLGSDATRLTLTTRLGQLSYSHPHELSNRPTDHTAQLTWRLTEMASAKIAMGRSRSAYAFDDTYPQLDTVTRDWRSASLTLKATPSIEFPVQVGSSTYAYADKLTHAYLDTDQTSASVSTLYRSPTGSTAQLGLARIHTRYPGRQRTDASEAQERDSDTFVELLWAYSVKTQATVRLTSRQRRFADTGIGGRHLTLYRLSVNHTLSPLMRFDAQLWRQPTQTAEAVVAYGESRGLGLGMTYTPSPKTTISLQAQKESQTDELLPGAPAWGITNPETTRLALRTQYEWTRGVNVFLEAAHEKRTRRVTQHATQNVWRVGLEYSFENMPGANYRTQPANAPLLQ